MKHLVDFRNVNRINRVNRLFQILLIVSLILGCNHLATEHFWRVDLTRRHLYSLTPETEAYLEQLSKPVSIISTITPDASEKQLKQLYRHVRDLLSEYEIAGRRGGISMVTVEHVDVFKERKKAEHLAETYNLDQPYQVLFVCEDRRRVILPTEIMEEADGELVSFMGERAFTSALIDVANPTSEKVYFVVGHREMRCDDADPLRGLSHLAALLQERNFSLSDLDLSRVPDVPEDAAALAIISPKGPLQSHEVDKLRRYLDKRAGRLIVMLDPSTNHGMDQLFYEWGILTDDMMVLDLGSDFLSTTGDLLIRHFNPHSITKLLIESAIPLFVGWCRPVRPDPGAPYDERLQMTWLVASSPSSWAERHYLDPDNLNYAAGVDLKGPISLVTLSERNVSSQLGINIPGGRIVVFGNSDMVSNHRIGAIGNYTLFTNTLNWCIGRDHLLGIPSRPIERFQLPLSQKELYNLGAVLLSLPAVVTLLGLAVHWIRSH